MKTITECQTCGRDIKTGVLCPSCERTVKSSIRAAISAATCGAGRSCGHCKGAGSTLQKVQTRDGMKYGKLVLREEMRRCPQCHGLGHLPKALPPGQDVEVAKLDDVGLERRLLDWRPIEKVGGINGLPRFSGTAFATNGVLVAIRRLDGEVVIGHLDSFEESAANAQHSERTGRKTKLQKLMEEFS